jgi:two-component system sensor kinase FixL
MYSRETRALMDAAVDAVIVVDHRGQMLAANEAAGRMFGYPGDELIGQNVSVLMPPPDRESHDGYLRRYLETGVPKVIGIGRQVTARRRDGSAFPARLSVGRVPDESPPRFVGLVRDVSNEAQATAALELERDRAHAFLELHDAILLELDAERRVRAINSRGAQLLGAPAVELRGRDWLDFLDGDAERERGAAMLATALASGSSREREYDVRDVGGDRRRIYWRCIALRTSDGAPAGWLCSGNDITDRDLREQHAHLAQERLTRVARLATMGEMAAGLAHEINQPLTAITSYARACEHYLDGPRPDMDEVRAALREIASEGHRAGEVIRRLRQMVRSGLPEPRISIDVNNLIEELRTALTSDARVHGAELRLALPAALPQISANGAQLQQVVLILARNAFEAVQELPAGERRVEIATSIAEGGVEIRVSDNGPGIAPQIRERLFDPFASTKGAGTGLGLAISHTIVKSHGGTIGTRSGTTRGATFVVRLPALEECLT